MGQEKVKDSHVVTFLLTTTLFCIGLIIGMSMTKVRVDYLDGGISSLQEDIEAVELGFLLTSTLENSSCPYLETQLASISELADEVGGRIVSLEQSEEMDNSAYLAMKKDFMLIRLKYWILTERFKKSCDSNITTFLYFYSIEGCDACTDQGTVLDYLQYNLDEVYVFPVDAFENLTIMAAIRDIFGITTTPSLVIDGSKVMGGLQGTAKLTQYLCEKYEDDLDIC
jgi:glutaredoxin